MKQIETIPEQSSPSELIETLMSPAPTVIGIEGGPCGGKTTLANRLAEMASDRPVVILPEAASQHIARLAEHGLTVPGLAANDRPAFLKFEMDVLGTIVDQINQAKQEYAGTDAIIVADRVDIGAYLTEDEYLQVLAGVGLTRPPMLDLVDHLYYLPSVAAESPEKYDKLRASSQARYETAEQAAETCQANLAAVSRHPELSIEWGGDFEEKMQRLTRSILAPELETELALEFDSQSILRRLKHAVVAGKFLSVQQISQSYHQLDGQEFRLRQATTERGENVYYFTVKQGTGITRHEHQRHLSEEEFELLKQTPQLGRTLHKTRYEFMSQSLPGMAWRKWSADFYHEPDLLRWQVEIDVPSDDNQETGLWSSINAPGHITDIRAKDLATGQVGIK